MLGLAATSEARASFSVLPAVAIIRSGLLNADVSATKLTVSPVQQKRLLNIFLTHSLVNLQVKTKGSRRITFEQFLTALAAVADAKKTSLEAVVRQVLSPSIILQPDRKQSVLCLSTS